MNRVSRFLIFGMVFCCGLAACSSYTPPQTFATKGRVLFPDGKPVRGGTIAFHPQGTGIENSAEIGSDGTFVLTSYGNQPGTVVGKYKITINPDVPPSRPAAVAEELRSKVAAKYFSQDKTDLVVEVEAKDNNFEIKLTK